MAKEQSQERANVRINLGSYGFPRRMYFNRYQIEKLDECVLLHFGLVDTSSVPRDYFSCVIPRLALEENSDRLKAFIAKAGATPKDVRNSTWTPPIGQFPNRNIEMATFINAAFHAGEGEITLYAFSLHAAILKSRGKLPGEELPEADNVLRTDPIIVLRCSSEVQKQLFFQLFAK